MPSVQLLRPQEVVKAFQKLGWEVARQRGSHIILTKEGHIATDENLGRTKLKS